MKIQFCPEATGQQLYPVEDVPRIGMLSIPQAVDHGFTGVASAVGEAGV